MSDRSVLNQRRLPQAPAVDPEPTEVIVTSTTSVSSTSGESGAVASLVTDQSLIEVMADISHKLDTIIELLMANAQ